MTASHDPKAPQQRLFELGAYVDASCDDERVRIELGGVDRNFDAALALLQDVDRRTDPRRRAHGAGRRRLGARARVVERGRDVRLAAIAAGRGRAGGACDARGARRERARRPRIDTEALAKLGSVQLHEPAALFRFDRWGPSIVDKARRRLPP